MFLQVKHFKPIQTLFQLIQINLDCILKTALLICLVFLGFYLRIFNLLNKFKHDIKIYYHISKQYYIDRELTFIRFTTIIKQICHLNNIEVITKIIYNKSKYEMEYYIIQKI